MPDDAMTISERRKYLERRQGRYRRAERPGQGQLLDEMEAMTGLHRKSLLRLLGPRGLERQPRSRQRGRVYGSVVDDALRVIWESLDYVCAERLTPGLVPTAQRLAAHGELVLGPELEQHLGQISVASVQRRLTRLAQDTRACRGKAPSKRIGWHARSRWGDWPGMSRRRGTLRWIWRIIAARPPTGSICIRSR